jgi:hypothetical protein
VKVEVVLTPDVALRFVTPSVSQNNLSFFQGQHVTYILLVHGKIKQTNKQIQCQNLLNKNI